MAGFSKHEIARVTEAADLLVLVTSHTGQSPKRDGGQDRYKVCCPFHEEKTPSFTIFAAEKRAKCFGCGWNGDALQFVQDSRGLDFRAAMIALGGREDGGEEDRGGSRSGSAPTKKTAPKKKAVVLPVDEGATADRAARPPVPAGSELVCIYDYERPDRSVAHQKIRLSPKSFRQRRPVSDGDKKRWKDMEAAGKTGDIPYVDAGWVYSLEGAVLYPYRLTEWMDAKPEDPLFFCEGEKDADTLSRIGLRATTFTDKNFRPEYTDFFRGRWVVMVEDYDSLRAVAGGRQERPGEEHAKRMGREFFKFSDRVSWLRIPDLWSTATEGTDITDFVAMREECFCGNDLICEEIIAGAEQGEAPVEVMYEGYYTQGERGGVVLFEDILANRIVQHRRLLSAGGEFWQWRHPGQEEAGTWRSIPVAAQVHSWIRDVLRSNQETLPMIESRRLNSLVNVMSSSNFAHPNDFNDHDPLLINCRSGMLHALTGELLPHNPRYLSTTQVPVEWDAAAECSVWMDVLTQLQPDAEVRDQIQEMFGYCLVPAVNYHVFFFLYGDGGTGKSTCADLLTALIGESNTIALQLEELDNGFTRSQLVGKQLYLAGELTSRSFKHIGLLKQIVAGEPIFVDVKNKPGFMYRPKGRFVMTSNVVAATPDTSGGFERRFLQIDWKNVIPEEKRDYELAEKLLAELPGVFRWAVEGYQRLHERGRFAHTAASRAATKELMRNRASVKEFLHDPEWLQWHPSNDMDYWTSTDDLYDHYLEWCDYHGVNAYYESANTFCKESYRRYDGLKEDRRKRRFFGGEREMGFWGVEKKQPEGWAAI